MKDTSTMCVAPLLALNFKKKKEQNNNNNNIVT